MNVQQITAALLLLWLIDPTPLAAQPADPRDEDTMVVVDRDAMPGDIVNIIRLPVPASEAGQRVSDAARRNAGPGVAERASGATAELAESARARGAETAREARERAVELAETLREAARESREERRGPPPEFEIELPAAPPNRP